MKMMTRLFSSKHSTPERILGTLFYEFMLNEVFLLLECKKDLIFICHFLFLPRLTVPVPHE